MQAFDLQIKVLTIGDSSVGKTCLLHRYTSHTFISSSIPTVGIDFKIMNITIDGKRIKMQCWDTAGQERYRNITTNYYRNAQGIILVYDITNRKSYEAIDNWMEQIHVHAGESVDKILVGNKADQEDERQISTDEGTKLAAKYSIPFFETSAKQGTNVEEAFYAIAKNVKNRLIDQGNVDPVTREGVFGPSTASGRKPEPAFLGGCC